MIALENVGKPVHGLAFAHDSRQLVISGGGAIGLWEVHSQRRLRQWAVGAVCPIAISPDGQYLGMALNGEIVVLLTSRDEILFRVYGHSQSVAFSPDGSQFAANGDRGDSLRRWSMPEGGELSRGWGEYTPEAHPCGPLTFSPDSKVLATSFTSINEAGRFVSEVLMWEANRGRECGRLRPAKLTSHASYLAFSPDGRMLVGLYGAVLIVWDVATGTEIVHNRPSKNRFTGLAFTPDGKRLLTVCGDQLIQVWAIPDWQPATGYAWKIGKLGCVAVSADGTLAAAGGSTGKVVVWDLD